MAASSDGKDPGGEGRIERRRGRGSPKATSSGRKDPVLSVADFGPIVEATVDLRPLTVFVGPSNTGKSYLAILIYALHRFFGDRRGAGPWGRRFPPLHSYRRRRSLDNTADLPGEALDAAFRWVREAPGDPAGAESPEKGTGMMLPERIAELVRPVLNDAGGAGSVFDGEITRCFGVEEPGSLIRRPGRANARITLRRDVSETSERNPPFEYEFTIAGKESRLIPSISSGTPLRIEAEVYEVLMRYLMDSSPDFEGDDRDLFAERLITTLEDSIFHYMVGPVSSPVHYLPADRTGVMHAHRVVVSSLIGRAARAGLRHDEPLPVLSGVLADFLEQIIELDAVPRRRSILYSTLAKRLEAEILGGMVRSERSEAGYPSFYYRPDGWKGDLPDLPLMNTSSMVSELAPVVLYLRHVVQLGDVLIIEEPESHLHPAMQVAFTRLLAAAVRSGVRIIVTTHSEWVLEALANLVRLSGVPKGKRKGIDGADLALTPDEVGAWLFTSKRRPRGSVVEEIPLDMESGTFPAGYGEVTESLYNDWARISSRIMEGRSR